MTEKRTDFCHLIFHIQKNERISVVNLFCSYEPSRYKKQGRVNKQRSLVVTNKSRLDESL